MRPKVAIVSSADPNVVGGQERQTLSVARSLSDIIEFVLVTGTGAYAEAARNAGLRVITIDMRGRGLDHAAGALREALLRETPDIVQTMEVRGNYLGRMAAHSMSPRPKVLSVRHELMFSPFFPPLVKAKRILYLFWDRFSAGKSDLFVAVAPVIARELRDREGIPAERIRVIGNGLPKDLLAPEAPSPDITSNPQDITLLFAGRLSPMKRANIAIRAFAQIFTKRPDSVLLIAGDGPERTKLERLATDLGVSEKITFAGAVPDLRPYIERSSVVLHPSVHEATPMVVMETMALGKPVIAAAVGGVPGLIENGRTGVLVAPGSVEAVVEAVTELLNDPAKRAKVGAAAREHALREFTEEKMVDGWRAVYEELLPPHTFS